MQTFSKSTIKISSRGIYVKVLLQFCHMYTNMPGRYMYILHKKRKAFFNQSPSKKEKHCSTQRSVDSILICVFTPDFLQILVNKWYIYDKINLKHSDVCINKCKRFRTWIRPDNRCKQRIMLHGFEKFDTRAGAPARRRASDAEKYTKRNRSKGQCHSTQPLSAHEKGPTPF